MAITYGTASGDTYWQLRGLSSDTKPIEGVPNGSTFEEIDTGNKFMFDAAAAVWYLQAAGGGTGGGTVTAGVLSFAGRQGNVLPQAGDYTAAMVGADVAGAAAAAETAANRYTDAAVAGLASMTQVNNAITQALQEIPTKDEVDQKLDDYMTEDEVANAIATAITVADLGAIDALFP